MRPFNFVAIALALPLFLTSLTAGAQGPGMPATPLGLDLKKVPVGSWSEYKMNIGTNELKARWALVARDAKSTTLETQMAGPAMAMMGGQMTMKLVLAPDPVTASKPVQQAVMQMPGKEPMEMPEGLQAQRFTKPDPKKLVGKEEVSVTAGKFKVSHYRDKHQGGTFDYWISADVVPLGLVKVTSTPPPGAKGPDGQPMPSMTMELIGRGKDAKATITQPAKPFDPAAFAPPGAAPPPAPPSAPKKK